MFKGFFSILFVASLDLHLPIQLQLYASDAHTQPNNEKNVSLEFMKKKEKEKQFGVISVLLLYTVTTECVRRCTRKYDEKQNAASVQSNSSKIIFIRCILPPFPASVEKCLDFIALLSCCCRCCCCYFF